MTVTAWFFCTACKGARNIIAKGNAIPPVRAIQDPQEEANALPPLNFSKGDQACPSIGANAIRDIASELNPEMDDNSLIAKETGIADLEISNIIAIVPICHPPIIQAFVAPGFPSPTSLTSFFIIKEDIINEYGIDPLMNETMNQKIRSDKISPLKQKNIRIIKIKLAP